MDTDLEALADQAIAGAQEYAVRAAVDFSFANPYRPREARMTLDKFELVFLFPGLSQAARDELALVLLDSELLASTHEILVHSYCDPGERPAKEALREELQTEYPALLTAWMDSYGAGLTPLQLEILRHKLGRDLPL